MKNHLATIIVGIMCTSFTLIPNNEKTPAGLEAVLPHILAEATPGLEENVMAIYQALDLAHHQLSFDAFRYAFSGYENLHEKQQLGPKEILSICDFSQPSNQKRIYIIDIENRKLLRQTYVAHGKNSGKVYATHFSNQPESLESSLGFYVTANTYIGKHGLSLRIKGVDKGFNDHAYDRTIVIHGAAYVDAARAKAGIFMGRSWGCPAVPKNESTAIINTIKNGTCFFIYAPQQNYLTNSTILND
ncbi:MAG TPA: murein L,D-transpeptidase catalytic domain family protein [Chitinophagaceae bacterium]|nr:murein L,D-transpeptidase catalytic domain family protein [Chitinophagaceae bacterium]